MTDSELISVIDTAYAKFRKEKGYCTEAMLRRAIADAAREEAIRECAEVCNVLAETSGVGRYRGAYSRAAIRIRALLKEAK